MRFYNHEGTAYDTEDPAEITRLMTSRSHVADRSELPADLPVSDADPLFHPDGKSVSEVIDYLRANPAEVERVRTEERLGANRKTITGDE
jgi:hypothetical protein